jgi:hypothetical protein
MAATRGSLQTRGETGTTHGQWLSTRTTPTSGTCLQVRGRTRRTADAIPKRISIGAVMGAGTSSPVGFRTPYRRCPTHWSSPEIGFSRGSQMGSCGRPSTVETLGADASSTVSSLACSRSLLVTGTSRRSVERESCRVADRPTTARTQPYAANGGSSVEWGVGLASLNATAVSAGAPSRRLRTRNGTASSWKTEPTTNDVA